MRSLAFKLTLAFLLVALIGAILVAGFVGLRTQKAFNRFVLNRFQADLIATLTDYYERNGSWKNINGLITHNIELRRRMPRDLPMPFILTDAQGRVIIGNAMYRLGDRLATRERGRTIPIIVNDKTVGRVLFTEGAWMVRLPESLESQFLKQVRLATIWGALGATIVALLLGALLAYNITRPVRELTMATHMITKGDLGYQVDIHTHDELEDLANAFNQMSRELARASKVRRQMTADIAHDLRTPLSVILGYAEALHDGKLAGSPETYAILHSEALHLQHLIEDLRTLSLADAGELSLDFQATELRPLLERTAAAYAAKAQEQGISIQVTVSQHIPHVQLDPERMMQVLGNLVSNALRYTPAGGTINLSTEEDNQHIILRVQDTGTGIAPESLPYVFERFYREDPSRRVGEGESGLGLAIAKSIVELHGGEINVTSQLGHGTTFEIKIPKNQMIHTPSSA